jgi:hypothetical protein
MYVNQDVFQIQKIISGLNWNGNIATLSSEFWSIWQSEKHRPLIESQGISVIKIKGKLVIHKR